MFLDCILLVLLVLLQLPKKEAGAGMAFGGAATDALFGAGSGNVLTKITKYVAGHFLWPCAADGGHLVQQAQDRRRVAAAGDYQTRRGARFADHFHRRRRRPPPPSSSGLLDLSSSTPPACRRPASNKAACARSPRRISNRT